MIIVVGGTKGGSGKTTLATNLTVLRSQKNKNVLLVDADEQKTSSDWFAQRKNLGLENSWSFEQLFGKSIHTEIKKRMNLYDDIIIDVGGRDTTSQRSALCIADIFLIPCRPRSYDIWPLSTLSILIEEIKTVNPNLISLAVINQADSQGSDNQDAMDIISEYPYLQCLPVTIGQRKSFANSSAIGLGVTEMKIQDKKAIFEMTELYQQVFYNFAKAEV